MILLFLHYLNIWTQQYWRQLVFIAEVTAQID